MDPVTYKMNLSVVATSIAQFQKALEDAYRAAGASMGVIPQLVQGYAAALMDSYGLVPQKNEAEEKQTGTD